MCGIVGIINFDKKNIIKSEIELMMKKIKHRGPDDEGVFINNNFGFGFVRLSILDLSILGHQPMFTNDGRFMIIFNGEIFNYIELKAELSDYYNFKTNTDTEVILASFLKWGINCVKRFNGMFAFVIYDKETNDVYSFRDRYGIKPFYYYHDNNKLIFASEIKSILPLVNKSVNNKIMYDYLLFNRTDQTNNTFFNNILKLPHGCHMKISNNNVVISKWYNLRDKITTDHNLSILDYKNLFNDSIRLRLRSDVPLGVSLSGGIDSSSIVSSIINDFKIKDLKTFSAVFEKNDVNDESHFIKSYESIVKNMYFTSPDENTFYDDYKNFIEAHNEPVPDTGPYIQYKVMQLAKKYVKVTLDGQGADEQLAGYHSFFGSYYIELIKNFKFLTFLIENYFYIKKHKSLTIYKYLLYYLLPTKFQNSISANFSPSISKDFINDMSSTIEISNINEMLYKPKSLTDSLIQHFEFKLEHLLKWGDLNSMNSSIESRVPFLDYRLVEATLSTPSNKKISKGETKWILRAANKEILPKRIFYRLDKKGFSNPREKWLRSKKFNVLINDILNSESFKSLSYFDVNKAKNQYQLHLKGKLDCSKEIWKWINVYTWHHKYIN